MANPFVHLELNTPDLAKAKTLLQRTLRLGISRQ